MSTKSTNSILVMGNGKKICKYCGKEIREVPMCSSNAHYYNDEWTEYECDCEVWKQYEKMNDELQLLNSKIYKDFCAYQTNWREIVSKYRKLTGNELETNEEWYGIRK